MTPNRNLWRRTTATVKDYVARISAGAGIATGATLNPEFETAVVRATSHDDRAADHKAAARVLSLARTSPSLHDALLRSVARRAARTRSWAVAIKSLMLTHGLILRRSGGAGGAGPLPFDLSDFRDRSREWELSAFVRAYFRFLDLRAAAAPPPGGELERMQELLDLVLQVRPYGDGAEKERLVLEAMECAVVEAFDAFKGVSGLLAGVRMRPPELRAVLRKAAQQSEQLVGYVELCRRLGVPHTAELPAAGRITEEIAELERMATEGILGRNEGEAVAAGKWVAFDDEEEEEEFEAVQGHSGSGFFRGSPAWGLVEKV